MIRNPQTTYITVIPNVQETILFGTANLDFWRARLQRENLFPFNTNGQAQILISGTKLKWMGLPMRELVVSMPVCTRAEGNVADAAYLVHAFNSSRPMAFMERAFFQSPYTWGTPDSNARVPAVITFDDGASIVMCAQMNGMPVRMRGADEVMEGAVYLPAEANRRGNLSFVKLSGYTEAYPFVAGTDTLELKVSEHAPVFQALIESGFAPQGWRIRQNATHARSKTYPRT